MAPPPKNDSAAGKASGKEADAASAAPAAAAPVAAKSGAAAWIPVIASLLLAPVATWATVEFVMLPRLQKKIASASEAPAAPAPEENHGGGGHGGGDKHGKAPEGGPAFQFENVVVNLAGTMGTRYLKTNIHVMGKDAGLKSLFEAEKPRLTDITQTILSGLTLADIEEAGSRNVIRAKLLNAYNEALHRKVVEEVYLTDFVVQ